MIRKFKLSETTYLVDLLLQNYKVANVDQRGNSLNEEYSVNHLMNQWGTNDCVMIWVKNSKNLKTFNCAGAYMLTKCKYTPEVEAIQLFLMADLSLSLKHRVMEMKEMLNHMIKESKDFGCKYFRMGVSPFNPMGKMLEKLGFFESDVIYTKELKNG